MVKKLWLIVMVTLAITTPALAQDSTTAEPGNVTIRPLAELVGADQSPRIAVLSPDGNQVAWIGRNEICVYTIDADSTTCSESPERLTNSTIPMVWSPDSSNLAYFDDVFVYLYEPDIHVFDVQSKSFRNLTDDQSTDVIHRTEPPTPQDYLPVWNPVTGALYFWRSTREEDMTTLSLYRFDSLDSEPQEVENLTEMVPQPYAVYKPAAISADGKTMAFLVIPQHPDDPETGLWTIDLESGAAQMIANLDALRAGSPDWLDEPDSRPQAVYWAGDKIVVEMQSPDMTFRRPGNLVVVSPADQSVTPVFDLSAYATRVDYANAVAGGQSGRSAIAMMGILLPDGEHYLYMHRTTDDKFGFASIALPPSDAEPVELGSVSEIMGARQPVSSVSADGRRALVMGYLIDLKPE